MRPCTRLQNPDFSSTILESQAESENQKSLREQLELESTFTQSPNFSSTILESKSIDKNQAQVLESTFSKVDSSVDCHAANAARNDKKSAISEKINSRQMQSVRAYACGLKMGCCDCALGFLRFAGVNAIYFYIAQGVSSSLLFPILRHFPPLAWWVKLPLAFCINLGLCVVFVWILIALFWAISHLAQTRTLDRRKP